MNKTGAEGAIPRDVALQLCADIRQENRNKWYSFSRWQCWGCFKFSRGDPEKICLSGKPGYRGCYLVNAGYARVLKKADK